MGRKKGKYWLLVISAFLLLTWSVHPVHPADELFLTGVVKRVDSARGLVIVEIRSGSCPGTMTLKVRDIEEMSGSEGKKISFFINTSTCSTTELNEMYDIVFLRG